MRIQKLKHRGRGGEQRENRPTKLKTYAAVSLSRGAAVVKTRQEEMYIDENTAGRALGYSYSFMVGRPVY